MIMSSSHPGFHARPSDQFFEIFTIPFMCSIDNDLFTYGTGLECSQTKPVFSPFFEEVTVVMDFDSA